MAYTLDGASVPTLIPSLPGDIYSPHEVDKAEINIGGISDTLNLISLLEHQHRTL